MDERVSKKKWIILSKEKFIDNRVNVFQIIRRSNARMFVLTAGDMLEPEMAILFLVKITQKGNFHAVDIEAKLLKAGML